MTQPTQPTNPAMRQTTALHQIVSILETIAFIVATILAALGHGNDAVVTALSGAVMHGVNHA